MSSVKVSSHGHERLRPMGYQGTGSLDQYSKRQGAWHHSEPAHTRECLTYLPWGQLFTNRVSNASLYLKCWRPHLLVSWAHRKQIGPIQPTPRESSLCSLWLSELGLSITSYSSLRVNGATSMCLCLKPFEGQACPACDTLPHPFCLPPTPLCLCCAGSSRVLPLTRNIPETRGSPDPVFPNLLRHLKDSLDQRQVCWVCLGEQQGAVLGLLTETLTPTLQHTHWGRLIIRIAHGESWQSKRQWAGDKEEGREKWRCVSQ